MKYADAISLLLQTDQIAKDANISLAERITMLEKYKRSLEDQRDFRLGCDSTGQHNDIIFDHRVSSTLDNYLSEITDHTPKH